MISASPLLAGEMASEVIAQLDRLITDQFRDLTAAGPAMYASFLGTTGGERERRHAHGSLKGVRLGASPPRNPGPQLTRRFGAVLRTRLRHRYALGLEATRT